MALTVDQALGIGVVVGVAGSLILAAAVWYIYQQASIQPNRIITTAIHVREPVHEPTVNPSVLHLPILEENRFNNWVEASHIPWLQLRSARELEEATPSSWCLESWCKTFFGGLGRQPEAPQSLFDESELVRLAGEPANGGTWSQSISNIPTRVPAIMCFLAQVMFKRMQPTCPVHECLLPPEISSCYQLVCRVYENPRRAMTIALWRESVFSLQQDPWSLLPIPCHSFEEGDPRRERVRAMVPAIVNALQPEALRTDQPRDDGLEECMATILEEAANSALILLGQRAEWEAVWSSPKPGFVVFPGLRFVWGGETKASRPAVVKDKLVWPMSPDHKNQPDSQAEEQAKPGAAEAPPHDALQLPEHKAAEHRTAAQAPTQDVLQPLEHKAAEHKAAEHKAAEDVTATYSTAAYSATDY